MSGGWWCGAHRVQKCASGWEKVASEQKSSRKACMPLQLSAASLPSSSARPTGRTSSTGNGCSDAICRRLCLLWPSSAPARRFCRRPGRASASACTPPLQACGLCARHCRLRPVYAPWHDACCTRLLAVALGLALALDRVRLAVRSRRGCALKPESPCRRRSPRLHCHPADVARSISFSVLIFCRSRLLVFVVFLLPRRLRRRRFGLELFAMTLFTLAECLSTWPSRAS